MRGLAVPVAIDPEKYGINIPLLVAPPDIGSLVKVAFAMAIKDATGFGCTVGNVTHNKETGKMECEVILLAEPMCFEITVPL